MNKETLDLFVEHICKKYNGYLSGYFENNPYNDIQKECKAAQDEFDSHDLSRYCLPYNEMTEDRQFTYKNVETGEEASEELCNRLNYLYKRANQLRNKNFIQDTDIIEIDNIKIEVKDFIQAVKEASEVRFTHFNFYNGMEVHFKNTYSKLIFSSPYEDELYIRTKSILDVDITCLENITNEIFNNEVKELNAEQLKEYDFTNLIKSLIDDNDVNTISIIRYLIDNNHFLTYKEYPDFKHIVDKSSLIFRIWRTKN